MEIQIVLNNSKKRSAEMRFFLFSEGRINANRFT